MNEHSTLHSLHRKAHYGKISKELGKDLTRKLKLKKCQIMEHLIH